MKEYRQTLSKYLKEHGIYQRKFAKDLGIQEGHLSKLIHGRARITPSMGKLIEYLTEGEVPWPLS